MKLTLDDITASLDLPASTIERWIRQGRIPLRKKKQFYYFKKNVLEAWAARHDVTFRFSEAQYNDDVETVEDELLSAMKAGGVHYGIDGASVTEVLASAVAVIPGLSREDKQILHHKLMEREKLNSTGIGNNVAIPHPRTPVQDMIQTPLITTCFLKTPVNYNAVDDKPVRVLFVILCPTTQLHLQLLSKLSFCIRDSVFRDSVCADASKPDADQFFEMIKEIEETI